MCIHGPGQKIECYWLFQSQFLSSSLSAPDITSGLDASTFSLSCNVCFVYLLYIPYIFFKFLVLFSDTTYILKIMFLTLK